MKFVASMAFIGLGYTIAYYGVSMWKRVAAPSGSASGDGIPIRVLLFGINGIDMKKPPQSLPPFQTTSTTAAPATNPVTPTSPTTPKVQSV